MTSPSLLLSRPPFRLPSQHTLPLRTGLHLQLQPVYLTDPRAPSIRVHKVRRDLFEGKEGVNTVIFKEICSRKWTQGRQKAKVEFAVIKVKRCPSQQRGGVTRQLLALPWVLMSDRAVSLRLLQAQTLYVSSMQLSGSLQESWRGYLCFVALEEQRKHKKQNAPRPLKRPKFRASREWRKRVHRCRNEQRATQKVRKSVSETGRGGEGKCKDLTGNQTINLLGV